MKRRCYIESDGKFPLDDWGSMALYGFLKKGYDIILFEDLETEVPRSKESILVACIDTTEKYLSKFGIVPQPLNVPGELLEYAGRRIESMTLGEFKKGSELPVFVKPVHKNNDFPAGVIKYESSRSVLFEKVPEETPVIVSEYINFLSEFRGYVFDGKLQGLNWYIGDLDAFPEVSIIRKAIADYKFQPAGYSIDFGVTNDGRTLLIECNDGWSLGNYGLDPMNYSTLLQRRWFELMQSV